MNNSDLSIDLIWFMIDETLRLMVLPANDGAGSKDAIVENVFYGSIRNPPNAVIFWFWILLLGAANSIVRSKTDQPNVKFI